MKRILRSFFLLLLVIVWSSNALAVTSPYSYTFKSGDFSAKKKTSSLNGVNWTLAVDSWKGSEGYGWDNNKGFKIGSGNKNCPNNNVTITTSEITGTIKSVTVNCSTNSGASTQLKVLVGGTQMGKQVSLTNSPTNYDFTGSAKGTIVLSFSDSNSPLYLKSINVVFEDGPTKTATTLTFTHSTINIEEGNEANFAAQTAKLKTGETVLNKAVTYTTNNDAMFEAYEANVGPKALKAGAYGTAVVTATFAGDDTYAASTATYTVNYTEKVKPATTLDFGLTTKTLNIDETFTATAKLKAGEATISGNVTYTSSKPKVATVNEKTGEVLALTAGKTTITATFAGNGEYKGSTASYELTVVDPNALVSTFDFVKNTYGYGRTEKLNKGEIISNRTPITIVNTNNGSSTKTTFTNNDLRNYKAAILTINAAKGYLITKITMTGNRFLQLSLNDNNGKWNKKDETGEWSGSSSSVSFTNLGSKKGNAVYYYTINIEYVAVKPVTLDESKDNAVTISGNVDKTVNVNLTRTLKADVWNTFCVPFDITVAGSPLEGATIKQIASVEEKTDGAVINFEDAPATLEAGKAYLVRTTTAIENPTFNGVTVKNVTPANCSGNENYQLIGIYSPLNIDASLYGKVFGINNQDKLAKVKENTSIKGMRAYFLLANSATAAKLNFGGELTGIDAVDNGEAVMTGKVYNLNGQYVGNSLEGLKKGVYVVNGKKVLK